MGCWLPVVTRLVWCGYEDQRVLASCGMRIAVIGKGKIGGSLGNKWRAAGHDVVYAGRDASGTGPGGAPVLQVDEALTDAEVVLLAVPG